MNLENQIGHEDSLDNYLDYLNEDEHVISGIEGGGMKPTTVFFTNYRLFVVLRLAGINAVQIVPLNSISRIQLVDGSGHYDFKIYLSDGTEYSWNVSRNLNMKRFSGDLMFAMSG